MTQEDLADRLNTAVRNVQRMESGQQNLTLLTLAKIAKAIGVEPDELVAGSAGSEPLKSKKSRS
jgi:transcriptional regulator with XRE-family HTH domain